MIAGHDLGAANEKLKVEFRRKYLGFVFQHFGLLGTLTVEENIRLPNIFSRGADHADMEQLLTKLQLSARRRHRPSELSGGEMQRVAIGRALYNKPKLLLADEPTGNLDSGTGEAIMDLFQELNSEGLTILIVTHNQKVAERTRRQIQLSDGRMVSDSHSAQ
jgi:putative ABC transport system ATP-binding protein